MKKEIRVAYIAVKIGLLALAAAFSIAGLQSLLTDGGHATTAICLWLGGMLADIMMECNDEQKRAAQQGSQTARAAQGGCRDQR